MLTGKKFITDTTFDLFVQDRYFEKFFIMESLNAFYSGFSILFGVAYYEFSYGSNKEEYVIYLYSLSLFSFFLIINLFLFERMKNELTIIEKTLNEEDNSSLTSLSKYLKLILISLFLLIHPNVFMKDLTYGSYNILVKKDISMKVNDVLLIIMLLRVFWIIRFIVDCTKYMDSNTNRICRTFYFKTNLIFSIKSLIKTRPVITILTGFLFSIGVFAFAVRIFERGMSEYSSGANFERYWNSIWLVTITMCTVGYGDFSPKTSEGRIICMIACIFGVFLLSLLIVAVSNFLQMNSIELNMFVISQKCKINDELNENAKAVITEYFHFLENSKMFNFQKEEVKDISKDKCKNIITKNKSKFSRISYKSNDSNIGSLDIQGKTPGIRKFLYKNARKLREKLARFDSSFNMTQNFSCENISFNILYNNFNSIFNDVTEALRTQKLQDQQIFYVKNQLKNICNYLESEKFREENLIQEDSF
jgi:hypothetical protein